MSGLARRFLLPGFVFQGILIGGGYATGRELVQFFHPAGPAGGVAGIAVAMLVFSIVLALSFELVRLSGNYDYRSFFVQLLGRGWFLFEIAYVLLLVVILAVIGAAAGEIAHNTFGFPKVAGTLALAGIIGVLVFHGSGLVERSTAGIAAALYACYIILVVWTVSVFGDRISGNFTGAGVGEGWFMSGVTYAGYNLAAAVGAFFCVRHARGRNDALIAGLLAGPIAMLPGLLFFIAMMAFHPEIGDQALPSAFVLQGLKANWFEVVFQLVVFGALIATGAPLLHTINERLARLFQARGRAMPPALRSAVSVGAIILSVYVAAAVGLVGLIAKGYGMLTWAFILLMVLPVLTVGAWRIWKTRRGN